MATQVIGIGKQSCTFAQITNNLTQQKVVISTEEMERFYELSDWLQVDAAFVCALWNHEGSYGRAGAMVLSKCPINIRAASGEWRPTVTYQGSTWLAFQSWQLGLFASVLHAKNVYGWQGLLTVEQIIPVLAPSSDGNNVAVYIQSVVAEMTRIAMLP